MLLDTHAHLDLPELSVDLPGVLERAEKNGVLEIITIGIDLPSSRKAVELARNYDSVFAAVGIHPHDSFPLDKENIDCLVDLARERKVVAIGEIGLDYYRSHKPRETQRDCLRRQLEMAVDVALPVVFHIREAFDDFFDVIEDYYRDLAGLVLHCFSGDWEVARRCLDMGGFLSIPGTVTYSKAEAQQEVVRRAPSDRLLLETDCPYLAPVPYRGKDNEPSYLLYTAQKVAELRGLPLETLAAQTTRNAYDAFRLDRWK